MVLGFFVAFLFGKLPAQEGTVSERDLLAQGRLLDAQREMLLGHPDKAGEILAELARKDPSNPGIAYAYAEYLARQEDLPGALREIRRAKKLDPSQKWYAITEAGYLEKAGAWAEAAEVGKDLVNRFPYEEDHYLQWAYYLIKDGRPGEAIAVYDRLESTLGPTSDLSRKKYMLHRGMGQTREAADVLEQVLRRQPRNTEVMYMLAELYAEAGATAQAREWYQRILDLHPGESEAQLALVRLGDPSQGDEDPLAGLARIFGDPQADLDQKIKAIIPYIQEFARDGDSLTGDRLDDLAGRLQAAHPGEAKVASIMGDLAFYRGRLDSAIVHYQAATRSERQVYAVWEQLLTACSEARQYARQKEWAAKALDLFPNQARILFFLAEAQIETRQPSEALESIQMGRLMARRDGYLLYHLALLEGRARSALRQPDQADLAFDQALSLNPRGPEAIAWKALSQRDPERACRLAGEAEAIDARMPLVVHARAWCSLLQSTPKGSIALLQDLVKRPWPHPVWIELMGDACALAGDIPQALEWWQRVHADGYGSPLLDKKIAARKYME